MREGVGARKTTCRQSRHCCTDLLPAGRTKLKLVKSVNHQENDGHGEEQIHRGTGIGADPLQWEVPGLARSQFGL